MYFISTYHPQGRTDIISTYCAEGRTETKFQHSILRAEERTSITNCTEGRTDTKP